MLSKDERERLRGLSKEHAENIGLHILAAFALEESDPALALEHAKWVAENAYGVPAERVIYKPGFTESVSEAMELCQSAGISLDDLAFVAVKSPATMTDNDRAPEEERTVTLKKVEAHAGAGLGHGNLTTSLTTPMPKIV